MSKDKTSFASGARWLHDMPATAVIALAVAGMLMPFVLLGAFGLDRWIASQRLEAERSIGSHADALVRALDRELRGYIETTEVLAGSRHLATGDLHVMDEIARDASARTAGHFVLFDRSLNQVINTRVPAGQPLGPTRNPDAATRAFATMKPAVSNLVIGTVSQSLQFSVHVPVQVAGEARYVLSYIPDQLGIRRLLSETLRPEGWFAAIIDGNGRIVARSARSDEMFGSSASNALRNRLVGDSGLLETVDLEGRVSVTAYRRSSLGDWNGIVWAPRSVLEAGQRKLMHLTLATFLLALALSMASAWIFGRYFRSLAGSLVEASNAAGMGRTVVFEPTRIREANIIGQALSTASHLIDQRERELKESEASLRLAMSSASAGAWEWNAATGQLAMSPEFTELCCPTNAEATMKLSAWLEQCVDPADRSGVEEALQQTTSSGSDHVRMEFRTTQRNGPARWVMSRGQVERDSFGNVKVRGIAVDMTERKRAEEQLRLVMRELGHRSKNMITVVQAMAGQTARNSATMPDFLERFRGRMSALASAQDMLIEQRWSGASLAELVRSQVATFLDSNDERCKIQGPAVGLAPDATQAIGLALHELATNSVKYGALSASTGRLAIGWGFERSGSGRHLRLSWVERGGPPASKPVRKGFGHAVIETMVAQKLDGSVNLDFAPEGLSWTLDIPMKHLVGAEAALSHTFANPL